MRMFLSYEIFGDEDGLLALRRAMDNLVRKSALNAKLSHRSEMDEEVNPIIKEEALEEEEDL